MKRALAFALLMACSTLEAGESHVKGKKGGPSVPNSTETVAAVLRRTFA
jgi:hypothetical protein